MYEIRIQCHETKTVTCSTINWYKIQQKSQSVVFAGSATCRTPCITLPMLYIMYSIWNRFDCSESFFVKVMELFDGRFINFYLPAMFLFTKFNFPVNNLFCLLGRSTGT